MQPSERRLRQRLAANLRRLRKEQELTVEALSERTGIHSRHIQKLEAGEVNATLATLAKLSDVLGVGVPQLLA